MEVKQQRTLARVRLILWVFVGVVAIAATALLIFRPPERPATTGVLSADFAVETAEGQPFTQASLEGTPSLVFFGYTFCPDVCPTTLAETTAWREILGLDPEQLRILFFTVDPERDTAEEMASYLSGIDSDIVGLTGNPAAVAGAIDAFNVTANRVEQDESGFYLFDHSAGVFLYDAAGEYQGTIAYNEGMDTALAKVRLLVGLPEPA